MKKSQSMKRRILLLTGAGMLLSTLVAYSVSAKETGVASPMLDKVCVGVTTCGPIINGQQDCSTIERCYYN